MLLEREGEVARAEAMLSAAAAGRGQMVVFEGEAGIGKTSLLHDAIDRADAHGLRVLRARAGDLEREFGYGIVRQLFEPVVHRAGPEERPRLLAGAAARAGALLHVGDALPVPVGPGEDPTFALLHALYWLTDNLSQGRPLLLTIDDAQWADMPSLRFLDHLARRLDGMPVGVMVTWRSGEPDAPVAMLDGLRREPAVEVLELRPLTQSGTGELIRGRLGEIDAAFAAACHETTAGNPFLLGELAGAVARGQLEPTADAARRVGELGPDAIARGVLLRLSQLPKPATRLSQAVAVLDVDGDLHRAGELAGLRRGELYETAAALQRANILAADEPLRFVHPILRGAIYGDLTSAERESLHRRAAEVLQAAGETQRAAAHLLVTQPSGDQAIAEALYEAGQQAREDGALETSERLFERALAEPAGSLGIAILIELLKTDSALGRPADDHVRAALEAATEPHQRVQAAFLGAMNLGQRARMVDAIELIDRAVADLPSLSRQMEMGLEATRASLACCTRTLFHEAVARAEALAQGATGETVEERRLLATLCFARSMSMTGTGAELSATADAAEGEEITDVMAGFSWSPFWLLFARALSGEVDACERLVDQYVELYTRTGADVAVACSVSWASTVAWLRGDLESLEARARDTLAIAGNERFEFARPWRTFLLVQGLLLQGRVEAAEAALVENGYGDALPVPDIISAQMALHARAAVRVAQGEPQRALADLDELCARLKTRTIHLAFVAETPLLLHAAGRHEQAAELAAEHVRVMRVWGVAPMLGTALRVLGQVTGSIEPLREAAGLLEGSYAKLELATALVEYGAALRRRNERQASREPLRRGGELAERCGARPLAERARSELAATGARQRSLVLSGVESLTASERRVAQMAADGMTNTEIAQSLWVTRKTVETHLRHVFQKLGVASRRELPEVLERDLRVTA